MDRFIDHGSLKRRHIQKYLKSNMDRFIEQDTQLQQTHIRI